MKLVITVSIMIFMIPLNANAQFNAQPFRQGYIVTTEGDTLKGFLVKEKNTLNYLMNSFAKLKQFRPEEVIAYSYGLEVYHNLNGYRKLIVEGPVKLYEMEIVSNSKSECGGLTKSLYYGVKRKEENIVTNLWSNKTSYNVRSRFTHRVARYFNDCPDFVKSIKATKDLTPETIADLIVTYNNWIDSKRNF